MNFYAAEAWAVRRRYWFLIIVGLLLYVAFLGFHDLWYPDELDIAEVALSMFNSGDWIAPRRMGEVWVDYPPMIYWAATISSHILGGMTAFAVRLPNALAAIGIVLMTCAIGSRWFDARSGLWAGFALLIAMQFMWQANGYRPDILFTLGIASGLFLYTIGCTDRPSFWLRAAGFACLGFAMLSKGILGLLLPGLVLFLWHGARREWKRLLILAPLSLISLALFVPWAAGTARAMGWDNLLHEFYAQNIGRFLSGSRGHDQSIWYYFKNFWVDLWPWAILFPTAVIWTARSRLRHDSRVQLLLWWAGTFIVFLSLADTKRQLYLLPAYPAIVLLLGHWLAAVGRRSDEADPRAPVLGEKPVRIASLCIALAFLVSGIVCVLYPLIIDYYAEGRDLLPQLLEVFDALRVPVVLLGILMGVSALWIGLAAARRQTRPALIRTGLSQIAIWVIVLAVVAPRLEPTKSYEEQGRWLKEQIGPQETRIGMVNPEQGLYKRGGFAYEMGGTMVDLLQSTAEVEAFFAAHPDSVVIIDDGSIDDIFDGHEAEWQRRTLRTLLVSDTTYVVVRAATRGH
jgi:4-amino-4-deoxy-L-arabinose transferase-like glycosyltransferase